LESKCLDLGNKYTGEEFCEKVPFLRRNTDGRYKITEHHSFYGQVQLGLFVCNLRRAKLLLYVKKNDSVIPIDIERNEEFLYEFVQTLTLVHRTYMLPFLNANSNRLRMKPVFEKISSN